VSVFTLSVLSTAETNMLRLHGFIKGKPHLYFRNGWWICRGGPDHGRARSIKAAYRRYLSDKKWKDAGCPMPHRLTPTYSQLAAKKYSQPRRIH